jgi:Fe-S-cluster containining protein
VFLDQDERCRIHAVAPFGCRMFTVHMSRKESDPIVAHGLRVILNDSVLASEGWQGAVDDSHGGFIGMYDAALNMLEKKGAIAAPLAERKRALLTLLDRLEEE